MKTLSLSHNKTIVLRLAMLGMIVASALTLLMFGESRSALASQQRVVLHPGDTLKVNAKNCALSISTSTTKLVQIKCLAFTPTATSTETESATETATPTMTTTDGGTQLRQSAPAEFDSAEAVDAPAAKLKRKLQARDSLKVTPVGCTLQIKSSGASAVKISCKGYKVTPTKEPGATPIRPEEGQWEGTTDENLPIYFRVTKNGQIENGQLLATFSTYPRCWSFFETALDDQNRFEYHTPNRSFVVTGKFTLSTISGVPGSADGTYSFWIQNGICGSKIKDGTWNAHKKQ